MSDSSVLLKLWLLVAAVALSLHLGSYALYDADEGRNGEVGREMAATNDYILPHLDGLPYLDKPVVYFAAEAAAMEVLGPTETAARLPALLFTFATALLIAWFALRKGGSAEDAWIAAVATLSMPLTLVFSRTVIFDSALTFFIVLAMIAFYLGVEERRAWSILAWAAIGFGVLTKGPVALALPLLTAIPYAIWRKRSRALWPWEGLLLFVAIIAPWVWAVSQVIPDFLHYVLVTETAQRLATKVLKRTGPPWYFIPYLLGGAFPWSIAAIAGWRELKRRDPLTVFLVLWVAIPFLFFSISQSKRPQYILPLMPAVGLLAARMSKRFRAAAVVLIILGVVLAGASFLHIHLKPETLVPPAKSVALGMGLCALLGGVIALIVKQRHLAAMALSLPILAIPLIANPMLIAIGNERSAKELVAKLQPFLNPQTEIVGIQAYTGSLEFYLQRPVTIVSPDAEELTSNYLIRHYAQFAGAPRSPLQKPDWLVQNAAVPNRIYIVRDVDRVHRAWLEQRGLHLIAVGPHHVAYKL